MPSLHGYASTKPDDARAAKHRLVVRGPTLNRVTPGGRRRPAARLSRQRQGRDTRTGGARPTPGETRQGGALRPFPPSRCSAQPIAPGPRHTHRRCAAHAGRDPAGRPCSLSLADRLSRQRHGRDTRTDGARPTPGETLQGGALLPPSRCSAQLTASGPRHTHRRCAAHAGQDPAGRDPAPSLALLGSADSVRAAPHAQAVRGPRRKRPGREGSGSLSRAVWDSRQRRGRDTRTGSARPTPGPDPAGRGRAPSLALLGSADSVRAATHAQAVRGPRRARPGGEGPCTLPRAARLRRQRQGRVTRTGGARPTPDETRR